MPRGPRLDAPGVLHHVMVRGIERRAIFRDDTDRTGFLDRLASLVPVSGLTVYAWALLPDHAHLLLRTGATPLARVMRRLLTGYAGAFNRRHRRHGHVFQNRYKSIVVEEESYFLELVRYLHLNPLRARVVTDLGALDRFPWAGHSALLGRHPRPWQDVSAVLARFAPRLSKARVSYRAFVTAGMDQGRREELQGGGLRRSAGGWQAVTALRRGREAHMADERVLGSSEFVASLLQVVETRRPTVATRPDLSHLVSRVCAHLAIPVGSVRGGGRHRAIARAREAIAYLWLDLYGQPAGPLAEWFGVHTPAVYKAARRGQLGVKEWDELIEDR